MEGERKEAGTSNDPASGPGDRGLDHSFRERPGGEADGVGSGREGPVWAAETQPRCPRAADVMDPASGRRRAGERSPVGDEGAGHCWGELRAGPDPGEAKTEESAGEKGQGNQKSGCRGE